MKKFVALLFFAGIVSFVNAQDKSKKMPSVQLKTVDGKTINMSELSNDGKPIYVSFWALWCTNCIKELNAINEVYADWQEETGVKVVAISIDDERNKAKVGPFADGQGWEYDVILDPNSEFKRAMNVNFPPHSFIINGNGEIVWDHVGYHPGDEDDIYTALQQVAKGESPAH